MKVLLLGSESPVCEDVRAWTERASLDLVRDFSPDLIVSYGFRWLLPEEVSYDTLHTRTRALLETWWPALRIHDIVHGERRRHDR